MTDIEEIRTLLNHIISEQDTMKYKEDYENQLVNGNVNLETKFRYSFCLIHSSSYCDIKKGADLLEEVFKEGTEKIKRDSLFFLAVAETKQKNYCSAKKYIQAFLSVEPGNVRARQLGRYVDEQFKNDGLTGMALFGAAAVAVGLIAIGAALGFTLLGKK